MSQRQNVRSMGSGPFIISRRKVLLLPLCNKFFPREALKLFNGGALNSTKQRWD